MKKIVINACYGGFGLSRLALSMYENYTGKLPFYFDIARDDYFLVRVVENLGPLAYGESARLRIVQIPEDVDWVVMSYDGYEWIAEKHRTWEGEVTEEEYETDYPFLEDSARAY